MVLSPTGSVLEAGLAPTCSGTSRLLTYVGKNSRASWSDSKSKFYLGREKEWVQDIGSWRKDEGVNMGVVVTVPLILLWKKQKCTSKWTKGDLLVSCTYMVNSFGEFYVFLRVVVTELCGVKFWLHLPVGRGWALFLIRSPLEVSWCLSPLPPASIGVSVFIIMTYNELWGSWYFLQLGWIQF